MGLARSFDTHEPSYDGINLLGIDHVRTVMPSGNFLDIAADSANLIAQILEFLGTTWKD
jgi:hypothetical protein